MQNRDNTIRIPSLCGASGTLVLSLLLTFSPSGCDSQAKQNPPWADASAPEAGREAPSVPEVGPEAGHETAGPPIDKQSCEASTSAPTCDPGRASATITRAAGGPLLAKITVTSGGCQADACATGCETISVYDPLAQPGGPTCQLLVTSVDGRVQLVQLSVVQNLSPTYACCDVLGEPAWVALNPASLSPASVSVRFDATDGGIAIIDANPDAAAPDAAQSDAGAIGIAVDSSSGSGLDGLPSAPDVITEQQACLASTDVTPCDPAVPATTVRSATGQPYLTKVEATSGSCAGSSCSAGCATLNVSGSTNQYAGATCDILVTLVGGSTQAFHLVVTPNTSPSYTCCGYPLPPHNGLWTTLDPFVLGYPLVVMPPGWDGGAITVDAANTVPPVGWDGGAVPVDAPPPRF
jgi:hypothetical protein